jgi:hypothetical protein
VLDDCTKAGKKGARNDDSESNADDVETDSSVISDGDDAYDGNAEARDHL